MNYKGYVGQFNVDIDTGLIRGMVINTRDVITFHGKTVEEASRRSATRSMITWSFARRWQRRINRIPGNPVSE